MSRITLSKKLAIHQMLSMGIPVRKIAELLEIGQSTVYRWKSNATSSSGSAKMIDDQLEESPC